MISLLVNTWLYSLLQYSVQWPWETVLFVLIKVSPMFLSPRVPTLCDFEPLHLHVEMLQQLVLAAQAASVDEMSQTITDLLSEQRGSYSQSAQRSPAAVTTQSDSTPGTTSSKTPSSLSLPGPPCQPLPGPTALEDLSPDSIDAQTFDFETIGHPNMDPVLQQAGSLDLDSLAESPESDFLSAVNEFVIENSPTPISDPTSPEMMVESLYSSVINAIDSKRMHDTTTLERENSKVATLKLSIEKYRSAAEESQTNLRSVKDDLYRFRGLVLKEQRDFGFTLKTMTIEVRNMVDTIRKIEEEELREQHQAELLSVQQDHEKQLQARTEENRVNRNIVKDVQRAMLELEGLLERKEKELTQLEAERLRWTEAESGHTQRLRVLEQKISDQAQEVLTVAVSRDSLYSQLETLHIEIERGQQKIRQELEGAEQSHLQELEERMRQQHQAQLDTLARENQEAMECLATVNRAKLSEVADLHAASLTERDGQLRDLEARTTELADLRCKLEVELALKESEMEVVRLLYEEAKQGQQEANVRKATVEAETQSLNEQLVQVNGQLHAKNEEYEKGLAELRTLMCMEKDQCISELVGRHEEERNQHRSELTALQQQAQDAGRSHAEQLQNLQLDLDLQTAALRNDKEVQQRSFEEQEQHLRTVICDLQTENDLLTKRLEQDTQAAQERLEKEESLKAAVPDAFKDFEQQKEEMEKRLLDKIRQLENELSEREAGLSKVQTEGRGSEAGAPLSLDSALQERLQQETASLHTQMELLERRKNEEMQNLKTSLIAEQQTNFNTVLMREKLKKEQIISELTEELRKVTQQQEKDKGLIETLSEDRAIVMQEKKQLEEELNRLRSTALVSSVGAGACSSELFPDPDRLASVAATRDDDRVDSAVEASMVTMSQSMSSVSSRHSEKIAIRDFQVGDLVLIILDERHDNYVLFTVGPTLYFLHSESLTALDLKPASGASRRPWVLGKVMEKEYCQAKKAQNRFKVPLGTKFYRVKAVPWNKKV
uniref:RB1 inducible coiled-coil 1 n=1 Tax=Hucho hucho TaxID=62062 RepID=A0A4W5N442_9TELE